MKRIEKYILKNLMFDNIIIVGAFDFKCTELLFMYLFTNSPEALKTEF